MQSQVFVIGAGPAGSAAAYCLARYGAEVVLADQCTFPREKSCGDGVSPAGVRALIRMGILDPAELASGGCRLFSGVNIAAPSGLSVGLQNPWAGPKRGFSQGSVMPRHKLDSMLVERATSAGATFLPGFRAMEPIWASARVAGFRGACNGRSMSVHADLTIVATGARLRLPRALGLCDPTPPTTLGIRAYLRLPTETFPEPHIRIYLEPNLLPDYAWVFPIDERLVNVGLTCLRPRRWSEHESLTALLQQFVAEGPAAGDLKGAVLEGSPRGGVLRTDFLRRKTYAAGVLVVGEAAGLVDPLTGEGISFALQSAELAAEVAHQALLAHEYKLSLGPYDRALRRRFASYFRLAWELRRRLSDPRLGETLVALIAQLKQVRADGWMSPAAARMACYVLHWLPILGRAPYLAFRLMGIRARRIEL